MVCFLVGSVIYLLLSENELQDNRSDVQNNDNDGHSSHDNGNERNAINFSNNYSNIQRPIRPHNVTAYQRPYETIHRPNASATPNLSYKVGESVSSTTRSSSVTTALPKIIRPGPTTLRPTSTKQPAYRTAYSTTTTTTPSTTTRTPTTRGRVTARTTTTTTSLPETTTRLFRVYANPGDRRKAPPPAPKHTTLLLPHEDDAHDNVVDRSKLLFPSKETLGNFGFTSGHQNSFGVPIEEDERVLRMLNEEMLKSQLKQNRSGEPQISQTTDANVYHTRVSPTLPNFKKLFATTERIRATPNVSDDGSFRLFTEFSRNF